ncbi:MAG: glycosyl transferase [Microbacteriaceae bacterium]|nr:glycosyl transferase [Microbacteriaceae bacterium]
MSDLRRIIVVVPARNEEELIARCLDSVCESARQLRIGLGAAAPRVDIVLVADSCTDKTVRIASRFSEVELMETSSENVGAARAAGILHALNAVPGSTAPSELETTWIANTDADSVVPPNWLLQQARLANAGADVMIGTVRPDFSELSRDQVAAWKSSHADGAALGHVHGANLGMRAAAYLASGGFVPLAVHEDVALVNALSALQLRVVASEACEVETSGRHHGRAPGGYARYLSEDLLARESAFSSEH